MAQPQEVILGGTSAMRDDSEADSVVEYGDHAEMDDGEHEEDPEPDEIDEEEEVHLGSLPSPFQKVLTIFSKYI